MLSWVLFSTVWDSANIFSFILALDSQVVVSLQQASSNYMSHNHLWYLLHILVYGYRVCIGLDIIQLSLFIVNLHGMQVSAALLGTYRQLGAITHQKRVVLPILPTIKYLQSFQVCCLTLSQQFDIQIKTLCIVWGGACPKLGPHLG